MKADSHRWVTVTPSRYPHERQGLEHVRDHLPDTDPYRAWANFEFRDRDGRGHEVDLLVLGPAGFHLVELKAWSGRITGDDYDWLEHNPGAGRPIERRSPLPLTAEKAKAFRSWLESQARRQGVSVQVPRVEECLFLHGQVDCRLPENIKVNVLGLEDAVGNGLRRVVTDRLAAPPRHGPGTDRARSKALAGVMAGAGLRRRPTQLRVGEWVLDDVVASGWGWEDRLAHHAAFGDDRARVRRWFVPPGAGDRDAALVRSAAEREYLLTRGLEHPGIVVPTSFHDLEGAAALVYPYDPEARPLDRWLVGGDALPALEDRLEVLRQVAEAVRYAHGRELAHRGLSPSSVLVTPGTAGPRARVVDWQAAGQVSPTASTTSAHAHDLIELGEQRLGAYAAPEVVAGTATDRRAADVFSLGALAYLVLTGAAPAPDAVTLRQRVQREGGLDVAADLNAAPESMRLLVLMATDPDVTARTGSASELLVGLDEVLDELTAPEPERRGVDPLDAQRGDVLDGGLEVLRTLGEGATSVALLVSRPDGSSAVLKAARDDHRAERLDAEARALRSLDRSEVVAHLVEGPLAVSGRQCLLVELAGERTLADELQSHGRLSLDRLQRWGRDLLQAAADLDEAGVWHRDIKPANLGFRPVGKDGTVRLALFDFSLAGASPRDLLAGTPGYRDPFLGQGRRRQVDVASELFSVAVTLHEMATASLPRWGDGRSDPAAVDVEVSVETQRMDPSVAPALSDFLRRALARDVDDRYDNAADMAVAWAAVFEQVALTQQPSSEADAAAEAAGLGTVLGQAGLSDKALSALERYQVATVGDLLGVDALELSRLPGAAQATKDEVVQRAKQWRARLSGRRELPAVRSLDAVFVRLARTVDPATPLGRGLLALLGQPTPEGVEPTPWPTVAAVAADVDVDRAQLSAAWRAARDEAAATEEVAGLRADVLASLDGLAGVASAHELATRLLDARGSHQEGARREAQALAAVRLVAEQAGTGVSFRRVGDVVLVAGGSDTPDAEELESRLDAAARLVPVAESLAGADVLPAPGTVSDRLRETVAGTTLAGTADARLAALAAAAAGTVAVSPRGELYPVAMPAARALRHAQGTLVAGGVLPVESLRRRVAARFPAAAPLPGRPALDALLQECHVDLVWNGDGFVPTGTTTRASSTLTTGATFATGDDPARVAARLARSVDDREMLALAVGTRDAEDARTRLVREHGATEVDVTRLLLTRLHELAREHGADWQAVLAADAMPAGHPDRAVVDDAVREAGAALAEAVTGDGAPVLLTGAGILARHGCTDLLAPLAAYDVARPRAVWLLAPQGSTHAAPTLDGAAVPLASPSQWLWLPRAWALDAVSL